jgi:hypothetical protein
MTEAMRPISMGGVERKRIATRRPIDLTPLAAVG